MKMLSVLILLLCGCTMLLAQVRMSRLVIAEHEVYQLDSSDIVVADTLIMEDSSRLILNPLKRENYIRASYVVIGNSCVIDGRGIHGKRGRDGTTGATSIGPCQNGQPGRNGAKGLDGTSGINLFLYIDQLKTLGSLTIDLSGGDGGDGGNGGPGGGGSPGTRHCDGGDGGNGGHAGAGGNGGNGGVLTLGGKDAKHLRSLLSTGLKVFTRAGTFGYGGVLGYGGPPGLGPNRRNGRGGTPGNDGALGKPGTIGTILFETNY